MTEEQWLASEDPAAMLRYLFPPSAAHVGLAKSFRPGDRKLRLWVEACRLRWKRDDRAFGNYDIEKDGLRGALDAWSHCAQSVMPIDPLPARACMLRDLIGNPFRPARFSMYEGAVWHASDGSRATVVSLARAAYDERLPSGTLDTLRLLVLSDALEEAGCDNADLLEHLRGECHPGVGACDLHPHAGVHYRGCWALDLLLGKESRA